MINTSQELLHIGFCNLVQVLWIICCFMWKRTRFLLLILPSISLFFFLSNFQIYKKNHLPFLRNWEGTQSWNVVHTWTVGWCIMYTWIGLLLFIYSFISTIFFPSNSKTLNFYHTFLFGLQNWNLIHTGQRVDLLCTPIQAARIYLFLYFFLFLSLQLAKTKNLHLQNCFNLISDGYGQGYVYLR